MILVSGYLLLVMGTITLFGEVLNKFSIPHNRSRLPLGIGDPTPPALKQFIYTSCVYVLYEQVAGTRSVAIVKPFSLINPTALPSPRECCPSNLTAPSTTPTVNFISTHSSLMNVPALDYVADAVGQSVVVPTTTDLIVFESSSHYDTITRTAIGATDDGDDDNFYPFSHEEDWRTLLPLYTMNTFIRDQMFKSQFDGKDDAGLGIQLYTPRCSVDEYVVVNDTARDIVIAYGELPENEQLGGEQSIATAEPLSSDILVEVQGTGWSVGWVRESVEYLTIVTMIKAMLGCSRVWSFESLLCLLLSPIFIYALLNSVAETMGLKCPQTLNSTPESSNTATLLESAREVSPIVPEGREENEIAVLNSLFASVHDLWALTNEPTQKLDVAVVASTDTQSLLANPSSLTDEECMEQNGKKNSRAAAEPRHFSKDFTASHNDSRTKRFNSDDRADQIDHCIALVTSRTASSEELSSLAVFQDEGKSCTTLDFPLIIQASTSASTITSNQDDSEGTQDKSCSTIATSSSTSTVACDQETSDGKDSAKSENGHVDPLCTGFGMTVSCYGKCFIYDSAVSQTVLPVEFQPEEGHSSVIEYSENTNTVLGKEAAQGSAAVPDAVSVAGTPVIPFAVIVEDQIVSSSDSTMNTSIKICSETAQSSLAVYVAGDSSTSSSEITEERVVLYPTIPINSDVKDHEETADLSEVSKAIYGVEGSSVTSPEIEEEQIVLNSTGPIIPLVERHEGLTPQCSSEASKAVCPAGVLFTPNLEIAEERDVLYGDVLVNPSTEDHEKSFQSPLPVRIDVDSFRPPSDIAEEPMGLHSSGNIHCLCIPIPVGVPKDGVWASMWRPGGPMDVGCIGRAITRTKARQKPLFVPIASGASVPNVNPLDETKMSKRGLSSLIWLSDSVDTSAFAAHDRTDDFETLVLAPTPAIAVGPSSITEEPVISTFSPVAGVSTLGGGDTSGRSLSSSIWAPGPSDTLQDAPIISSTVEKSLKPRTTSGAHRPYGLGASIWAKSPAVPTEIRAPSVATSAPTKAATSSIDVKGREANGVRSVPRNKKNKSGRRYREKREWL